MKTIFLIFFPKNRMGVVKTASKPYILDRVNRRVSYFG